jgi:hypothetical protein
MPVRKVRPFLRRFAQNSRRLDQKTCRYLAQNFTQISSKCGWYEQTCLSAPVCCFSLRLFSRNSQQFYKCFRIFFFFFEVCKNRKKYLENMATYLAHIYVNHAFHCAHFNDSDQCLTTLSGNRVYWIPSKSVKKYVAFSEPKRQGYPISPFIFIVYFFFVAQQPNPGLGSLTVGVKRSQTIRYTRKRTHTW